MVMTICQFKKDVYVNCENKKSGTVTVGIRAQDIE